MEKTILYFLNYDQTVKVGNPGKRINPKTKEMEDLPRVAPEGYYKESITTEPLLMEDGKAVEMIDVSNLYYMGPRTFTEVNTNNLIYKDSWTLIDEEVFRY